MSDSLRPRGLQPPGSSVPGILQVRGLEWGAIAFSAFRAEALKWSLTAAAAWLGDLLAVWVLGSSPEVLSGNSDGRAQQPTFNEPSGWFCFRHCFKKCCAISAYLIWFPFVGITSRKIERSLVGGPLSQFWETIPDLLEMLSPGNQGRWPLISLELLKTQTPDPPDKSNTVYSCIHDLWSNIHITALLSLGDRYEVIRYIGLHGCLFRCLQKQTLLGLTQSHLTESSAWIIGFGFFFFLALFFKKGCIKAVKIFWETHYHFPSHTNSLEENENRTFCPVLLQATKRWQHLQVAKASSQSIRHVFFSLFKVYLLSNFPVSLVCNKKPRIWL